ncbi:MAG TPA: hypothetical protein VE569_01070 [Acidimicrobiia bacterium]|nr:hypothetical protein [Acidimicrobiia bacterium]
MAEFDINDLVPGRSRIAATPHGAPLAYKETLVIVEDDSQSAEVVPMPSLRNVNDLVMVEETLWLSGTMVSDTGTIGVLLAIDPTTAEVIDTPMSWVRSQPVSPLARARFGWETKLRTCCID